jgi:hypothetical protein
VRQRAIVLVGEELLNDGVVAVLAFGLDQLERGISEDRVVAPGREQLVLPDGGLLVQVTDAAHDQPRGDLLSLLRGKRRVFGLGDLGVADQQRSWSSQIARGYWINVRDRHYAYDDFAGGQAVTSR